MNHCENNPLPYIVKVGKLGLGLIGGSLAKRLLNKKFSMSGYDSDTTTKDREKVDGIDIRESVEELSNSCDLFFLVTPQVKIFENCRYSARSKMLVPFAGSASEGWNRATMNGT